MDLNTLWFILIAVLFTGFFFLEGFDYGVGILLPFLSKKDKERRVALNAIGPFWDGNEVWLLTAGGAMFAAFPEWYATLFSGFYLPLVFMLLALIVRVVAFEYRAKHDSDIWRAVWDWCIFFGSFVPALLWGVAMTNLVVGTPIGADKTYVGGFFNLLNINALLGGLAAVCLFAFHGALFLTLKTEGPVLQSAKSMANRFALPALLLLLALGIYSFTSIPVLSQKSLAFKSIPILAGLSLAGAWLLQRKERYGLAFALTGICIAATVAALFVGMFPNVMISSLGYNLTIYNASSSPYTLRIMSFVVLIFLPIVLGYQIFTYWIFRKRVSGESKLTY